MLGLMGYGNWGKLKGLDALFCIPAGFSIRGECKIYSYHRKGLPISINR